MATMMLKVGKCPSDRLALTNKAIVKPGTFASSTGKFKHAVFLSQTGPFLFSILEDASMGDGVGFNGNQRKWASLALTDQLTVIDFQPGPEYVIGNIAFELDALAKTQLTDRFNSDEIAQQFSDAFHNTVFTVGQPFLFEYVPPKSKSVTFNVTVTRIDFLDLSALAARPSSTKPRQYANSGILTAASRFVFAVAPAAKFSLTPGDHYLIEANPNPIEIPSFSDWGVGGLDVQFGTLFRRAFASRILPLDIVKRLGIQHVKGILLYGPPGTGKTLLASKIASKLGLKHEPKFVQGPEILNKFVGQSEESIRELFKEAEEEYKQKGDSSSLHVIIMDEIDAICKQRGSTSGGTGVNDSIVNQLLAKIDGLKALNNILLIGMTNRIDMIDEALLRPGRLELKLEIQLPNEEGRRQIFDIHTKELKANKALDPSVDLQLLAAEAKNFSGAEIAGLVRAAVAHATSRVVGPENIGKVSMEALRSIMVTQHDFELAMLEILPAFGADNTELSKGCINGMVAWGDPAAKVMTDGLLLAQQAKTSVRTPLVSVLLHGAPGSGKTALAVTLAQRASFPFTKLISPENMVGYSELAKCSLINKVFEDAYKSEKSIIVIDDIERLLEYVPLGPRFSNAVLQTLLVLLKKLPKKGRNILILATTSNRNILETMGFDDCFSASLYVQNITQTSEVLAVLQDTMTFSAEDLKNVIEPAIQNGKVFNALINNSRFINIGVKKLYSLIETAAQDSSTAALTFVDLLYDACPSF